MARVPGVRVSLGAAIVALPVLLGAGCAAMRPPSGASAVGPAELAERLPVEAASFRRGEARPAVPGPGREAVYATAGGGRSTAAATVELLVDDTAAAAALDAALGETLRAGPTRQMREAGRLTLKGSGGASPLFCAETAGRYGRERVTGLLCAGRVGGALLRIRVTMPAREPPPADPRAFAEAIAAALAGTPVAEGAVTSRPG